MKKIFSLLLVSMMLTLSACDENAGQKERFGKVGGAVLGGLAGSQIGSGSGQLWATGAGAILGSIAGTQVGRSLDKADMAYARTASEQASNAPIGDTISWNNPDSGNSGSVTPVRDGYSSGGDYCREYKKTVYIDGKAETAYGTACKNPDGTWRVN